MNRETIYNAVLAQVETLTTAPYSLTIPTIERDFHVWEDVTAQPAVFVVEEEESAAAERGQPYKWTLDVSLWVYAQRDGTLSGISQINPILDALAQLFGPSAGAPNAAVNTLGGLVSSAMLHGKVEKNAGYLGTQAIARAGLRIIAI